MVYLFLILLLPLSLKHVDKIPSIGKIFVPILFTSKTRLPLKCFHFLSIVSCPYRNTSSLSLMHIGAQCDFLSRQLSGPLPGNSFVLDVISMYNQKAKQFNFPYVLTSYIGYHWICLFLISFFFGWGVRRYPEHDKEK